MRRLHLGEGDLAADLGLAPGDGNVGLGGARTMVVLVSAAVEIESPVAPVSVEYRNLDGFADDTRYLRRLGFWGRVCIHPKQIDIVNDIFTVSAAEVDWANDVLRRLGQASASGIGVAVDADGRMIDEAIARIARRVLKRA